MLSLMQVMSHADLAQWTDLNRIPIVGEKEIDDQPLDVMFSLIDEGGPVDPSVTNVGVRVSNYSLLKKGKEAIEAWGKSIPWMIDGTFKVCGITCHFHSLYVAPHTLPVLSRADTCWRLCIVDRWLLYN